MATFLLEIGSEEIPAGFLARQENALNDSIRQSLKEANLAYGRINVCSTPRRLVLKITELASRQAEVEEIVSGPAEKVAYNPDGSPTKALEGFCKSQGVNTDQIFLHETAKGRYVAARKKTGGKSAEEILAKILPGIIASLPFGKKMRWGEHELAYARPVRWVAAMLDDRLVNFDLGHIKSGNVTYGHRVHGFGPFLISHADKYDEIADRDCRVLLDAGQRKKAIMDKGNLLAGGRQGQVIWKDGLLEEVIGLVEHPVPILGEFDSIYLEIPEEVLLTSMESHQKSFGVRDQQGKLLPVFLTVLNLEPENPDIVRHGWERVLRARLEDARFFWREDLKTGLQPWLDKLEHVIFIGELGSMADKSRRLDKLCGWLANATALANAKDAVRAGELSKADLVSGMVGEFDSLQGIMGGIYAERAGETEAVSKAIAEQYLPAGPDTPVPATPLGAILSIADKADLLSGCFGIGRIPTGAADQDGLRRAALGIIRIMLAYDIKTSLEDIFRESLKLYGNRKWKYPEEDILAKLADFMRGRLRNWFVSKGYNNLVVDAVLDKPFATPSQAKAKIAALSEFYDSEDALLATTVFKRMENITRKVGNYPVCWNEELLKEKSDKKLAATINEILPQLDKSLENENYGEVLSILKDLRNPLDEFFENTMIMCDDEKLRNNRLGLLGSLLERFGKLATFSKLQIQG